MLNIHHVLERSAPKDDQINWFTGYWDLNEFLIIFFQAAEADFKF